MVLKSSSYSASKIRQKLPGSGFEVPAASAGVRIAGTSRWSLILLCQAWGRGQIASPDQSPEAVGNR